MQAMRTRHFGFFITYSLIIGCTAETAIKPEVLDERTGITVAALQEPIEMVQLGTLTFGQRASFAYFGPVEWNRTGVTQFGLWVHVAPGNDQPIGDIHEAAAVALVIDNKPVPLTLIEVPPLEKQPYEPKVSWGQSAYFGLSSATLIRLGDSRKIELQFRGRNIQTVRFIESHDNRAVLAEYARARHAVP